MTSCSCVLVVAEQNLRDALSAAVRMNGYEVLACQTPLEAIQLLERHSSRIGYAVLSPAAPRVLELRELLADEYPAIQPMVLSV
jgi:DNA-binding response OmpR family regulator